MSLPKYEVYKDGGDAGREHVPAHWDVYQLRRVIDRIEQGWSPECDSRPAEVGEWGVLKSGCVNGGRFNPLENKALPSHLDAPLELEVKPGDLLMSRASGSPALIGSAALVGETPSKLLLSDKTFRLHVNKRVQTRFLTWCLASRPMRDQIERAISGAAGLANNLPQSSLVEFIAAFPPEPEQDQISNYLDREAGKIDDLISEQEHLIELLKEELQSLVVGARYSKGVRALRLGSAAELCIRPVEQKSAELYRPLGLFNRGRGIFHKDAREMSEMGDSDFFWVRSGDLIISGQFAWEGAVGLAGENEDGCVVSHRYPVLSGRHGVALTEYIFALLLTRHGDFMLAENSWGAAGRNRPLNIGHLMKEPIWVPDERTQQLVANAVHGIRHLEPAIAKQRELLLERRSTLIAAAVTGKIDVRGLVSQTEAVVA